MTASTPKLRVARYIRVSRLDQNPQLQADETAHLIASRGWQLVDTFVDHGVSGAKDRRPELDRMLVAAKRGKFDIVLVWRSDRLARSLRHLIIVIDDLAALGVGYVSVTEPFDTTLPSGRLLLQMCGAFAEFERAILIERVRAGQAAARRRGVKIGRPRVYVSVPQARVMMASGMSMRATAKKMAIGVATLSRALKAAESGDPEPSMQAAPEAA